MNDEPPAAPPQVHLLNNPALGRTHVLPIYSSRSSAHGYIPPAAHPSGLLALRVCLFHIWIFTAMPLWELHSATARGNIWSRGHNPVYQSFVQSAICCRSVVNEESVGKERKGHQCEHKRLVAKDKQKQSSSSFRVNLHNWHLLVKLNVPAFAGKWGNAEKWEWILVHIIHNSLIHHLKRCNNVDWSHEWNSQNSKLCVIYRM